MEDPLAEELVHIDRRELEEKDLRHRQRRERRLGLRRVDEGGDEGGDGEVAQQLGEVVGGREVEHLRDGGERFLADRGVDRAPEDLHEDGEQRGAVLDES